MIRGAVAAFSVLALLTACTPSSDPDTTREDAKSAEASAEPVFRVGTITDEQAEALADGETASAAPSESPSPADTAAPAATGADSGKFGDVVASGDDVDLDPGQRIGLSVENAVIKDVAITDTEHPRVSADPGTFFDVDGTALKADDEDPQAGASTPTSSDSADSTELTDSEDSKSPSADDESPGAEDDAKKNSDAVSAPDDSASWISTYDLVADSGYELTATATTENGEEVDFTTQVQVAGSDASPMSVKTIMSDDQTVGVAAPIIFTFGSTVAKDYRDDVEHRLSVKVTDKDGKKRKVKGSWAWLPDDPQSRLHFRPKDFWPAHSKVSVEAPLKNVPTGENSVGGNSLTLDFEIGRKQVVKADAKSHRMVVTRDGKEVMDFPASLGAPKSPSYNGTHVVMSKSADYTMTSQQWDYETDVKWAVRIHNNGEFIHAAPWSAGAQGSRNVSHGCVNLSTERAKEYYDSAIFGDPVEITGSDVSLSTEASDISDWVYDWDEWKKLSALD